MKLLVIKFLLKKIFSPRLQNRLQVEAFQQKKIRQFELFLRLKSRYFSEKLLEFGSFENLPLMDKSLMMKHFDEINTAGIVKEEALQVAMHAEATRRFSPKINGITVGLSSGTSGNRGIFLVSDSERAAWVANVFLKLLSPFSFKKRKIAFFLRTNSNLYETIRSQLFDFQFFDLKNDIIDNLNKIHTFQPNILVAPPSMLLLIAKHVDDQQISISPQKIISVAEVLEKKDEVFLINVFKQIIHQAYQCTEGFLASTCRLGTLHFHEDLVKIEKEFIDKNRFYPIITDFSRTSQPIVRYKLNDIIHEKREKCACGSPFLAIEHIEGRSDDIFEFLDKNEKQLVIFPDFIRKAIITASETIEEFLAEQVDYQTVKIYLKTESFEKDCILIEQNFKILFSEKNISAYKLVFSQDFPLLKDAKLRRVKRNF